MIHTLIEGSRYRVPREDIYPSRNGMKACLLDRQDPVVYASESATPPVAPANVRRFEEQGFVVLDQVFSTQEVESLLTESVRLRTTASNKDAGEKVSEPGSDAVRSIFAIHNSSEIFSRLAQDERLAGLARYLLDDDVYIHQSRLNYKPRFRGKEFYWHSDFETWHVEDGMPRMRALSMSVLLTESVAQNGPLMLIPGSHKQYVVCEGSAPKNHHLVSLKQQEFGVPADRYLTALTDAGGINTATGSPGSVIVFDCNTMHGSNGNITPYPRSNVFFVYNALSNKVAAPFGEHPPRPEHICTRQGITAVTSTATLCNSRVAANDRGPYR